MNDKLKPCPFCGSDKIVKTTIDGWGVGKYRRAKITCKNCGLKTRYFEEEFKGEYVEDYWNRRVENDRKRNDCRNGKSNGRKLV